MIQPDGGHQRDFRQDDVGGIQPPADAHFDHGEIYLLLGKVRKGQGRAQFKGGGEDVLFQQRLRNLTDAAGQRNQIRVGNGLAHHLHPLVVGNQIRGSVHARAVARLTQDAFGIGGGGALAVGAGNVHAAELILRIAQGRQQRPHIFQSVFLALVAGPLNPVGSLRGGFEHTFVPPAFQEKAGGRGLRRRFCEVIYSFKGAMPSFLRTFNMVLWAMREARSAPSCITLSRYALSALMRSYSF